MGWFSRDPAGDRASFEALAMPLAPALYASALRMTRRPEDAADCVQETFLRAYRTFSSFTPGTNARAWLFRILYSILSNRWEKEKREKGSVSLEAVELPDPGAHLAILRGAGMEDTSPEVERALADLPEGFRAALLLVDVEELSYEEAAAALGVPVGTLRSRLFRGRRMLAARLAEWAGRTGQRSR